MHWSPELVKVLGKIFSLLFALFFTTSLSFGQGVGSTAVNFEVDANFQSNNRPSFWNFTNPNQNYFNNVNGDDWSKGATGNAVLKQLGGVSVPGLTADRSALWQVDGNWGTNVPPDLSVFGGTSNKNGNPIGAGQSPYTVSTGSGGPQKNDITNVYLHTRRNPANNNLWLFFGAETRSVNGSSYLDFEYNQAGVTVANGFMTGDGPLNGRSINDVLLVINYTKGGSVPVVGIRKWLATGTWSDELTLPANSTFMSTNAQDIAAVAPGKAFAGDGTPSSTTIAYQFVEGAINVSVLDLGGLADACTPNATITIKTRSSASYTSELKDWDIMHFPLTPSAMAAVADITPICAAASGANTFNVTGTYADGTPLWSTTAGTLSNQVYNADGTTSATLSLPAGTLSAVVKLTTTSSNSACPAAMSSKTATVYPRPVVEASATPSGSLSILTVPPQYALHTTVDGVLDPSSGYTFSWVQDPPSGGLSSTTIPNPTFSAPAAGDYTWTVTVTNANGCINPSSVSRTLIPQAPCPAVNRPPMCAGTTYTFSADVGPASGETWKWTANNGATVNAPDNAQSVSVTAGTQNFTLTLTKTYANPALSPQVCPYSVTVNPSAVTPAVSLQTITCTATSFSITITNPQSNTTYDIYQLDQNHIVKAPPHASPLTVTGLHLSQGYRVIGTTNNGCISAPTDCGNFSSFVPQTQNVVAAHKEEPAAEAATAVEKTAPGPVKDVVNIKLLAGKPSVSATPNPYNEKVHFSIVSQVSGYGTLDIYNLMGQKIKTIYQGNFEQFKTRIFDYNVPAMQRTNLIYVLRVGDQKISGLLIATN